VSRGRLDYSARRAPVQAQGFDPDRPVAGFYRTKLRRGAVPVGIRIWFGVPLDPVTGEELDRSPRWQATANGRYIDLERVWPGCADEPIDEAEHRYLCSLQAWGEQHAPDAPHADPTRAVDLLTAPIPLI
jgi:hypothetical protein